MTPAKTPTHRRDTVIILAALIVALGAAWGTTFYRLRQIKAQNEISDAGLHSANWPCEYDAQIFCSGISRGEGRVNACLDDHEQSLSPACAQYRDWSDGAEDWVLACDPELHSVCSGRIHQLDCLKGNRPSLSTHCLSRIVRYETSERWRRACLEDAARLCPGVSEELASACLADHAKDLGTSCRIYYAAQNSAKS